jgi:hypothetical protein
MKTFTIILSLLFSLTASMTAQQVYEWEEYGLSFDLADDFKETVNTESEFTAVGDGMIVSIHPFADADIDDADITAFTIAAASNLSIDQVTDIDMISLNGFKGGYTEVVSDGHKVFIMGLIDPNSDVNFFIVITFADGDGLATQEAIAICQGLQKM